jgi:hypothetical protein
MTAITRTGDPFDPDETPGAGGFNFLPFGWVGQIDLTSDSSAITTVETGFGSATINTRNDRRYLTVVNMYTEQSNADELFLCKLLEDGVEVRRWRISNNVAGSSGHVTPTLTFSFAPVISGGSVSGTQDLIHIVSRNDKPTIYFGAYTMDASNLGPTAHPDVDLYRDAASQLRTGASFYAANFYRYVSSTAYQGWTAYDLTTPGASGRILMSNGTGTWGTAYAGVAAGNALVWNGSAWASSALDLADTDATTNDLPFNRLAQGSGYSVLGVTGSSTADNASIVASASGQVLRYTGTAVEWGALDLADVDATTNDLPFSRLPAGTSLSVLGVAGNASADHASIAATAVGQVLRYAGSSIGWGALDLADSDAVTGDLPLSNVAQGTALSVLGVTGNATADNASIVAGADGAVLRRVGTTVAFGTVPLNDADSVTGILAAVNGGTGNTNIYGTANSWTALQTTTMAPASSAIGGGLLYLNTAVSPTANYTIQGWAVNGTQKARLDVDGDLELAGDLTVSGDQISIDQTYATAPTYTNENPSTIRSTTESGGAYMSYLDIVANSHNGGGPSKIRFFTSKWYTNPRINLELFDVDTTVDYRSMSFASGIVQAIDIAQGSTAGTATFNINPATITANYNLLYIGNNSSSRFTVDAEGDTAIAGEVTLAKSTLLTDLVSNPTIATSEMRMWRKGKKLVFGYNDGGTTRYTSIDFGAAGNSWSATTTTAP